MKPNSPVSLNNVMDLLLDAICVVDVQGHFVFVSAACERIFGYTPEEMIGKPMIDFVFHEDRPRTLQAAAEIVAGHPQPHFENRYVRKDGQIVHVMWSARWSETDQVRVAVARDVTQRKRADSMQAALYDISEAAHWAEDLVTLFQQIHQIIGGLLPAANFFVSLYDEDKAALSFPYLVDEHDSSHMEPATTALIEEIIRGGQILLLTPDAKGNSLNWLRVPLNGVSPPECAEVVAEKIRVALDRPFDLAGHTVHAPPSIGIALHPEHSNDYTQLIRHADEAMYEAKRNGGNRNQESTLPGSQK